MRAFVRGVFIAATLSMTLPVAASAQDAATLRSPVLVVEPERLYRDSAFGQRISQDIAEQSAELARENRRIEAELEAEEKDLTEQRRTLEPAAFRELADAFDEKVRELRREQENKARAIIRQRETGLQEFLTAAAPVLEQMMQEAGAVVVLERQTVFLSLSAIDITEAALERINQEIGDGSAAPEE
ncbi:OmpH family outer membrane protein [Aliishimia ponticola]|uniref:OmpH family outer membrane protein n=1 Tax=Aliishimia ponticola TaxID=2499833 RepID=A0A4S4NFQ5_9RHOB|nr:OmpH family outer membrane protein [Aliishimia ponticola]THH38389.1 OmpH family outer membrane protein [Aliishimia ponticola]